MEEYHNESIEELMSILSAQNGEIENLRKAIENGKRRTVLQMLVCGAVYFILSLITWFIFDIPSIRVAITTLFPATELTGTVSAILLGGIGASTAIGILMNLSIKEQRVQNDLKEYKIEFEKISKSHQDNFDSYQSFLDIRLKLLEDCMNRQNIPSVVDSNNNSDKPPRPPSPSSDHFEIANTNVANPPISVGNNVSEKENIEETTVFSFKPSYK